MPENVVEVRLPSEAELEAVTVLLVAQLREHHVRTPGAKIASAVQELFRRPERGRILIAVEDGRPVGVAALSFAWPLEYADRSAWLEELYVEPPARGRGIGTRLLRAALQVAAESGATAVDLEVEADHQRAASLYAREGFRSLARTHWVRSLEPVEKAPAAPEPSEITGGCFCGAIRYRVSGSSRDVSHCHCSICRRTTGAPLVTWATFPAASFIFTAGTPAEFRATSRAVRQLCPTCGTALTFRETARPHSVDVTVGSMDSPDVIIPAAHIWTSSQLAWLHVADDLPRHPEEDPNERDTNPWGQRRPAR
jgi:GNAT superfamily N-acetyltransferase